jgi:glutathione synthase/RimK-type ligase-like ATP-grasp enzyme
VASTGRIRNVVIVADPDDVHAQSVALCIEQRGGVPMILDTRTFPKETLVSGRFSSSEPNECRLNLPEARQQIATTLDSPISVWWRRPNGHSLAEVETQSNVKKFSFNESRNMLLGTLMGLAQTFVNDPGASRRATLKPYQLHIAANLGFNVARTLVTNNPAEAGEFVRHANCRFVYKTFTGTDFGLYETRLFEADDYSELWRLENAPIILQEHVDGEFDLRITIVGDGVFAARVMYREGNHPVDSRMDRVPVHREELPADMIAKLVKLRMMLGLDYMAVDMRYSRERGYVFFEVNPEGQYLWIEIETGLPISDALARALLQQ